MGDRAVRRFRIIEAVICGVMVAVGVAVLLSPRASSNGFLYPFGFAVFAAAMFELRIRGVRKTHARVRRVLEEIGQKDFDAPQLVGERQGDELIEELAANPAIARMIARNSTRLFVAGSFQGRTIEIGTAIVSGRDADQRISYACVLEAPPPGAFRVMSRGALTSMSRAGMNTHPVPTGDAAFDEAWVVDADAALCRAVLDESLRAKLVDLRSRLAWMQAASIEATRLGVIVRWPGDLDAGSAAYLRDLALDVQLRLGRAARA